MKVRLLAAAAVLAFTTGTATAQDTSVTMSDSSGGFFYIAPEVLGMFPRKDKVDNSTFVGGRLGYFICPNFAAEIESGWVRFRLKDDLGRMNTEPLLVNGRLYLNGPDEPWDVFLMGGLGVAFNRLNTKVPDMSSKNTFAIQTGTGAEWRFNQNLALVLDIRYFWNNPDISGMGKELRTDSFTVGGGLSWSFR